MLYNFWPSNRNKFYGDFLADVFLCSTAKKNLFHFVFIHFVVKARRRFSVKIQMVWINLLDFSILVSRLVFPPRGGNDSMILRGKRSSNKFSCVGEIWRIFREFILESQHMQREIAFLQAYQKTVWLWIIGKEIEGFLR